MMMPDNPEILALYLPRGNFEIDTLTNTTLCYNESDELLRVTFISGLALIFKVQWNSH